MLDCVESAAASLNEEHAGLDMIARGFVFCLYAREQAGDDKTECECGG